MEAIHDSSRARKLGISNVTLEQLFLLCEQARVRPRFVQNRCYATTGWDRRIRQFCAEQQIIYQGFSLLTANRNVLRHRHLERIAQRHGLTVGQIAFRFALDVGMLPLTGTTSAEHMRQDLAVTGFHLDPDEVARIESIALN
jgi:diketogulonate reductase-like aldo/keto reductase